MHNISISKEIKEIIPGIHLGCIQCPVKINSSSDALLKEIESSCKRIEEEFTPEIIREIPSIKHSKNAYRSLGKDPNRYRLSAEALMRRIVNGKGLYQINNIIDTLNLISIRSGISIGGYDSSKVSGNIQLVIGSENDEYNGIGRGPLNISRLPVLKDELSVFGNPTSDSQRTSVNDDTREFLMVFFNFSLQVPLKASMDLAADYLHNFAGVESLEQKIIR